jgi:hypothetical protein
MTFVTVFRRVPKPITGMIGIQYDADFERFQANLDWLETTGVSSSSLIRTQPKGKSRSDRPCDRFCRTKENTLYL